MATAARVQDPEAIKHFRTALIKFIESASTAVTDAEGEVHKKMGWLEGEMDSFWTQQIRKWQDNVAHCKEAVRMKTLYKDASGRVSSAVDEQKALKKAQQTLAVAEEKLVACKKHARQLQREHLMYRGGVQRLQTMLSSDLSNAVTMLENVLTKLDAYFASGPALAESAATGPDSAAGIGADGEGTMTRAAPEDEKPGATETETGTETAAPSESPVEDKPAASGEAAKTPEEKPA